MHHIGDHDNSMMPEFFTISGKSEYKNATFSEYIAVDND